MLHIGYDKLLARMLGTEREELLDVLDRADDYYEELILHNPEKPNKKRTVVCVRGKLRKFQERFYRGVLLRKLPISPHSHGGVRKRNIKTNAKPHLKSRFVFTLDIQDFYPSIKQKRIYRLFNQNLECSSRVASLCTRLCTYNHELSLGLVTSPFLANQIMLQVDKRIEGLCNKANLKYSRFVDDMTISGPFDFQASGIPNLIDQILKESGFTPHPDKYQYGEIEDGFAITCIRRNSRGNIDVESNYARKVEQQLAFAIELSKGHWPDPTALYYTSNQIRGRIYFIKWINRDRGNRLLKIYRSIDWNRVDEEAQRLKLVIAKKQLVKIQNDLVSEPV
tara:strand:+ start:1202 stop:2212 length:1011 start_codon:yes stop_codon:yes gene_type:complete